MRKILLAIPLAVALGALSACGSAGSSGSTGNSGTGASSGSSAANLTQYQQAVQSGTSKVTWSGPTTAAPAPRGKYLVVVTCTEALEGCKLLTQGSVHAAQAIGWRTSVINVTDPTKYDQAVQTAISQGANGIVLVGVDSRLIPGGLAAAHAKHVPVVSIFQYNKPSPTGVDAEVSPNANTEGKLLADAMIVNAKGNVNVLFMPDAEFSLPVHVLAAAKRELDSCSACHVTYGPPIDFTAATVNTTLPGRVVSELRTHPDINSILVGFDPPATFIIPAIDNAGLKSQVKMYSQLGTTSALSFVAQQNVMAADVGASNEWGGWAGVDEVVRLLDHMPVVDENVPVELLTASNLPPPGQPFTGEYANFKAKYLALWKR